MIFLSNIRIETFCKKKNAPFSSLKSVHVEYDGEGLGTLGSERTLSFLHLCMNWKFQYSKIKNPRSILPAKFKRVQTTTGGSHNFKPFKGPIIISSEK